MNLKRYVDGDFDWKREPDEFESKLKDRSPDVRRYDAVDVQRYDAVHHPSHYAGKIEVIDYIRDKLTPEEFKGYCKGNVLKYISRAGKKKTASKAEDLQKAEVYLKWWIEEERK